MALAAGRGRSVASSALAVPVRPWAAFTDVETVGRRAEGPRAWQCHVARAVRSLRRAFPPPSTTSGSLRIQEIFRVGWSTSLFQMGEPFTL